MSVEYDRLLGLISQCGGQTEPGIVHKADDEDTYVAARIERGRPVNIERFSTLELAKQHAFG